MKQYPLISADSHFDAPPHLADKLPPEHRLKVQHLETRSDGIYLVPPPVRATMMGDSATAQLFNPLGGQKVDPNDEVSLAIAAAGGFACEESRPGFSIERRLEEMERDGVVGEVLIDNGSLGQAFEDPVAEVLWARIVNDWLAATFKDHMDKFAPSMRLPFLNATDAAAELQRGAKLGLRAAMLPYHLFGRNYAHAEWEPVWEAAERNKVVLVMHATERPGYTPSEVAGLYGVHLSVMQYLFAATAETIGALVNSGVFERYPKLQVAFIETDAGYLDWYMASADHFHSSRYAHVCEQYGMRAHDLAPPSYYVRRNIKASFMWDPVAIRHRHEIGMNLLMWGNDYPHTEGLFPHSREHLEKQFAGVPDDEVIRIVHDNAAELFGLTV